MRYSIYKIDPKRAIAGDHSPECIVSGEWSITVSDLRDSWMVLEDDIKNNKITEPGTYLIAWQSAGLFLRVYEVREPRIPLEVVH